MSSVEPFILTLWTADPALAAEADAAGVDRIGVDLEHSGKEQRQSNRGTWISPHSEEDVDRIGPGVTRASLFARVDALHHDSARQIDSLIARGVRTLMLPMVMTANDASRFVKLVRGRATVILLVEHIEGIRRLDEIAAVPGVGEIHIGLNDLALSLGLRNRWLSLGGELIADAGAIVRRANLRFGLGGIGRAHDDSLPVPSDLVYAEYARTGATSALIARSFFRNAERGLAFEIARARERLREWQSATPSELEAAHEQLARCAESAAVW